MKITNLTTLKRTISAFLIVAIIFLSFFPFREAKAMSHKECCVSPNDMGNLVGQVLTKISQELATISANIIIRGLTTLLAVGSCNSKTGNGLTLENFPTLCLPNSITQAFLDLLPKPKNHNADVWSQTKKGLEIKYPAYCEMSIPGYETKKISSKTEEDCYKLKKIYDLSFIEAVAAKKLVDYTDPFGKGNPLKACRSHCYIGITDKVLAVLFWELCIYVPADSGNGVIEKLKKVIQEIQEIQKLVGELEQLQKNLNALKNLAEGVKNAIDVIQSINIGDITNSPNLRNLKSDIKDMATASSDARKSLETAKTKINNLKDAIDNSSVGPQLPQAYQDDLKKIKALSTSIREAPTSSEYISNSYLATYVNSLENTLESNGTSSNVVNLLNQAANAYSQYLTDALPSSSQGGQTANNNTGGNGTSPIDVAKDQAGKIIQDINNYKASLDSLSQELERVRNDVVPNISSNQQYAYEMITDSEYEIPDMKSAFDNVLSKAQDVENMPDFTLTDEQKQQIDSFEADASTTKSALDEMVKTIENDEKKLKQVTGLLPNEAATINQVVADLNTIKNNLDNNLKQKLINVFKIDETKINDADNALEQAIQKVSSLKDSSKKVMDDLNSINTLSQLPGKINEVMSDLKPTIDAIKSGSLMPVSDTNTNTNANNSNSNNGNSNSNTSGNNSGNTSNNNGSSNNGSSNSNTSGNNSGNTSNNSGTQGTNNQMDNGTLNSHIQRKVRVGLEDLKDHPKPCTGYRKTFNLFPSFSIIPEIMSSAFQIQILTGEMHSNFALKGQASDLSTYSFVLYLLSDILKRNADQVKCGDPAIHKIPLCISKAPFCIDPFLDPHYWMVIGLRMIINSYANKILHIIKNGGV